MNDAFARIPTAWTTSDPGGMSTVDALEVAVAPVPETDCAMEPPVPPPLMMANPAYAGLATNKQPRMSARERFIRAPDIPERCT